MGVFTGSPQQETYAIIDFVGTVLSTVASIITILVINKMKITGYIKLILTMTWFQLIYDATFFNGTVDVGIYYLTYVANLGQLVGGIGSSLVSNWIAYVVLYVVYNKRSIDIMRNYKHMLASALIPGIVTAIIYSIGALPEGNSQYLQDVANLGLYYYTRLISIFLNFIMFGLASYYNHKIRSKGLGKSPAEQAINTLCRRLMYYPLLQAISRSGFAWYEFQYGYDFNVSTCAGDDTCFTALIYATIITPTVSFGYLALFLKIEPHAYEKFRELFGCGPPLRGINMSKDSLMSAASASQSNGNGPGNGNVSTTGSSARAQSTGASSAASEDHRGAPSAPDTVHTAETLSTNAYVERESSLYNLQQQRSTGGWLGGSSLFHKEMEEADDRDEAALLQSIDSESHLAPPRLSFLNLSVGHRDEDAGALLRDSRGSLVGSVKSALRPLFPSSSSNSSNSSNFPTATVAGPGTAGGSSSSNTGAARKTVSIQLQLQSSTTSPIIGRTAGLRDSFSASANSKAGTPAADNAV